MMSLVFVLPHSNLLS